MKRTFQLLALSALIVFSAGCGKDEEDTSPSTPSNVDLTGDYAGEIEQLNSGTSIFKGPSTMHVTNKSGNVYNISGEKGGDVFAELTVSGKNFTGKEVNESGIESLTGSLNGDVMNFTGKNGDTTYIFNGTRPSGSGGGADDIYKHKHCWWTSNTVGELDGLRAESRESGEFWILAGGPAPELTVRMDDGFKGVGTYTVDADFTDKDFNYSEQKGIANGLTITEVNESTISGSVSITFTGGASQAFSFTASKCPN